ncbi:MAG: heme/hemin ABC transporter substrate-binding protein [Candidatus Omnitrophota bacterium]
MTRYMLLILIGMMGFASPIFAERIVTLAPAITEIVFSLGKGKEIVGNTKFCNYPEEAKRIPRIGGLMDVNLEMLISQKPDVVILYPEVYEKIKVLKDKVKLIVVNHIGLDDLYSGIAVISKALHTESKGKELTASVQQRLEQLRKKSMTHPKIKTLLIIGRNPNDFNNMYIIGANDYLNTLLDAAGGVNAYSGHIKYPSVSIESVVTMNPEAIIELSAFNEGIQDKRVVNQWKQFPFISAVKNNKIKIVKDAKWVIPGPRVAEIAEEIYRFYSSK